MQIVRRVARVQRERRRRLGDALGDERAIEAHGAARAIDVGPGRREAIERLEPQELDTDALEDRERCVVDALDLLGVEHLDRAIAVAKRTPRTLANAAGRARVPPAAGA